MFIGIGLVKSKEVEADIYSLPVEANRAHINSSSAKYLGLVLTLAVNLAVMALALTAVLGYMAWMAPAGSSWRERPALDPAMLGAPHLLPNSPSSSIAVFPAFSTPILSAALPDSSSLDAGADLRNFNQVIDSALANGLTTAVYWLLPEPVAVRRAVAVPATRWR